MIRLLSQVSAGATAVFVGYSSAVVLILEAASQLDSSPALQSAWLLAVGLAMGISTIALSLYYKAPVLTAWSTPGIALLIGSLTGLTVAEAVGVFVFSSSLMVVFGVSGLADRMMKWVPSHVAAAILAGILLKFVSAILPALNSFPIIAGGLIIIYFICRAYTPRWVFLWLLLAAITLPFFTGKLNEQPLMMEAPQWIWVWPDFNWPALIGVGIPLFVVTMVSQNVPGVMMLRANGYAPPTSPLITTTGLAGLLLAPLGAFAINLAAITAAICQTEDADPDPAQRYKAAVAAGGFYILMGLAGSLIVSLFMMMPQAATATLAGLALLPVITQNLQRAFSNTSGAYAAAIAFIVTVADISFFSISSAFWGLLVGCVVAFLSERTHRI
ncbi:hypothetical protein BFR57_07285 [Idiomarina sp. MD25a]|nr:hypothetical protein BFR57_07285 [Idiomarina sp. MD25a]